jgi:oligopeptide/dipeptide ABC transporter ATP-binding protein
MSENMVFGGHETLLDADELKTYLFTSAGVVKAVDGVSLKIRRGESVGLVGESGCGKTMTALSFLRLLPIPGKIVGGRILFDGLDLAALPESQMREIRGSRISMVFQDPMTFLNPVLTAERQIGETIKRHQMVSDSEVEEKVVTLLEKVGIANPRATKDYYPHQLSGGMRQRILIATAISCNPSLLIADEPTTALDVTVQAQILELLRTLVNELNASLLLITHDLGVVAEICDSVYVMYAGKIVEHGDVYSVFEEPKHPYTVGLLKSVLSIDEFKKDLSTIEGVVPNLINPPSGCRFHPRCPHVMNICRNKEPKLDSGEHQVSCFLYGGGC